MQEFIVENANACQSNHPSANNYYEMGKYFGSNHFEYLKSNNKINNESQLEIISLAQYTTFRDIKALMHFGKFNYILLDGREYFFPYLTQFVPKWANFDILFEYYALLYPDLEYIKIIEQFCDGFLDGLFKYKIADAFLISGFYYHTDYGFLHSLIKAFRRRKIPVVCICNENITIPSNCKGFTNLLKDFKFKFYGNGILTFSDIMKNMFAKSGVLNKNKIKTIGSPRLDFWRDFKPSPEIQNNIVLFAFPQEDNYGAGVTYIYTLHIFAKKSYEHGNVKFYVKCKNQIHKDATLEALSGMPHNLIVEWDLDVVELLRTAKASYTFNSLIFAESLLSNVNVYVPYFSDSVLSKDSLQVYPTRTNNKVDGFSFINTLENLEKTIEYEVHRNVKVLNKKKRLKLAKKYFLIDKKNSATNLLENFMLKEINNNKSKVKKNKSLKVNEDL